MLSDGRGGGEEEEDVLVVEFRRRCRTTTEASQRSGLGPQPVPDRFRLVNATRGSVLFGPTRVRLASSFVRARVPGSGKDDLPSSLLTLSPPTLVQSSVSLDPLEQQGAWLHPSPKSTTTSLFSSRLSPRTRPSLNSLPHSLKPHSFTPPSPPSAS